jgi:hypothetical protein
MEGIVRKRSFVHLLTTTYLALALTGCGDSSTTLSSTPAPKTWGTAELVGIVNTGDAYQPQVDFDAAGNAIVVWHQSNDIRYNIMANRYTAGSGWGTPELIETDDVGSAYRPQIDISEAGNALAVWYQFDGAKYNVMANRYERGVGWGTPELIETDDSGDVNAPQVAFDNTGNAIAVWNQFDGTRNNIMANRYIVGSGWKTAELIDTDNIGNAFDPQIDFDKYGNAIAVWSQSNETEESILANRYTAGTGWGTPKIIGGTNSGIAASPQVDIDLAGNAIVVWNQLDGTRFNILANYYTVGSGWGTAELVEIDNVGNAFFPQVAFDGYGNAVTLWQQDDGIRVNITANTYTPGSGWDNPTLIETDDTGDTLFPKICSDLSGYVVAVWQQNDGTLFNIWTNSYRTGSGWNTATLIETDHNGGVLSPQISLDRSGNAIAVWSQSDGTFSNIMSNRFE